VLFLHAACYNYAGMVTCRLFLGILEAGITPSFILLTGRFYRRQEQVIRTSFWFSMNGWAQILGGLISYGILGQAENDSLKRWKQLFLVLGAITVFFGVVVFFFMPADPATAKFLTPRERMIAVERMREVKTGGIHKEFKMSQFWESVRDPRLYLFFFAVLR
jgi:ACS family allantoate permease-like MFS transporter